MSDIEALHEALSNGAWPHRWLVGGEDGAVPLGPVIPAGAQVNIYTREFEGDVKVQLRALQKSHEDVMLDNRRLRGLLAEQRAWARSLDSQALRLDERVRELTNENAMLERDNAVLAEERRRSDEDWSEMLSDQREATARMWQQRNAERNRAELHALAYEAECAVADDLREDLHTMTEAYARAMAPSSPWQEIGYIEAGLWDSAIEWAEPTDLTAIQDAINTSIQKMVTLSFDGGAVSKDTLALMFGLDPSFFDKPEPEPVPYVDLPTFGPREPDVPFGPQ